MEQEKLNETFKSWVSLIKIKSKDSKTAIGEKVGISRSKINGISGKEYDERYKASQADLIALAINYPSILSKEAEKIGLSLPESIDSLPEEDQSKIRVLTDQINVLRSVIDSITESSSQKDAQLSKMQEQIDQLTELISKLAVK